MLCYPVDYGEDTGTTWRNERGETEMNSQTKKTLDLIIKLSTIREFDGNLLVDGDDFVGVELRFVPPIPLDAISSIKELAEKKRKEMIR